MALIRDLAAALVGTHKSMTLAELPILPHRLYARLATLLVAMAALGWVGGSLAVAIARPQDPTVIREPVEAIRVLLSSVNLSPPSWLVTAGEWMNHHKALGAMLAATGGAAANGSALTRGPLKQGGGALICWATLLVAAESVGPAPALRWTLTGAAPFLLMAVIWAALAGTPKETTHFDISWAVLGEKLLENINQFVMVLVIPVAMLLWLVAAYGCEIGKSGGQY